MAESPKGELEKLGVKSERPKLHPKHPRPKCPDGDPPALEVPPTGGPPSAPEPTGP